MKGFLKKEVRTLEPGALVAERYCIVEVLGQGGMGVVYKARDLQQDRDVALKMILRTHMAEDCRRFEREARAASLLKHPNVIAIHDFGIDEQQAYLSMEYLEGRNLDEIIEKKPLTINQFRHIFAQACSGLQQAHEMGIVHRDLKPSNLMIVERDGDKESVIVLDFGLVKLMDGTTEEDQKITKLTRTNMLLGSPLYMSPEQCRSLEVDHRSDIYSLGCVMYEALTGTPPLVAESLLDVMNKHISEAPPPMKEARPGLYVPAPLERLILSTMAKAPDERPQSMSEVARRVESAFSGAPDVVFVSPRSVKSSAGDRPSVQGKSNRKRGQQMLPWVAAGVALLVGSGLTMAILARSPQNSNHDTAAERSDSRFGGAPNELASGDVAQPPPNYSGASTNVPAPGKFALPPAAKKGLQEYDPIQLPIAGRAGAATSAPGAATSAVPGATVVPAPADSLDHSAVTPPVGAQTSLSNNARPVSTIAAATPSIVSSGGDAQPSADRLFNEANLAYRQGDWARARSQFEAALNQNLSSEKQVQAIGKLAVAAYRMGDASSAATYMSSFKDKSTYYSPSSGDSQFLVQVYDVSRLTSDRPDYVFNERILRAAIDDRSRQLSRPDSEVFRLKLELNRAYMEQNKFTEAEQLLQQLVRESDQDPSFNQEAKAHLARVQHRLDGTSSALSGGESRPELPDGGPLGGLPPDGGPPGGFGGPFGGPGGLGGPPGGPGGGPGGPGGGLGGPGGGPGGGRR